MRRYIQLRPQRLRRCSLFSAKKNVVEVSSPAFKFVLGSISVQKLRRIQRSAHVAVPLGLSLNVASTDE